MGLFDIFKTKDKKKDKKFKGYRVDAAKKSESRRFIEENYYIYSGNKKTGMLRHGELLTENDVKKMNISKKVKDNFLIPIEINKKDVEKHKKGAGERDTKEVSWGKKPKIRGDYKPNKMNVNNYERN